MEAVLAYVSRETVELVHELDERMADYTKAIILGAQRSRKTVNDARLIGLTKTVLNDGAVDQLSQKDALE